MKRFLSKLLIGIFIFTYINVNAQPIQIDPNSQENQNQQKFQNSEKTTETLIWDSMSINNPFSQNQVEYAAQGPDFPPDVDDNGVPVDGGLSILIAAGLGLGAKRIHSRKKQKKALADQASKN